MAPHQAPARATGAPFSAHPLGLAVLLLLIANHASAQSQPPSSAVKRAVVVCESSPNCESLVRIVQKGKTLGDRVYAIEHIPDRDFARFLAVLYDIIHDPKTDPNIVAAAKARHSVLMSESSKYDRSHSFGAFLGAAAAVGALMPADTQVSINASVADKNGVSQQVLHMEKAATAASDASAAADMPTPPKEDVIGATAATTTGELPAAVKPPDLSRRDTRPVLDYSDWSAPPQAGLSRLVLYDTDGAYRPSIFVNKREIARLRPQRCFAVLVEPGDVDVNVENSAHKATPVVARSGETLYIRAAFTFRGYKLIVESESQFRKAFEKMALSDDEDFKEWIRR